LAPKWTFFRRPPSKKRRANKWKFEQRTREWIAPALSSFHPSIFTLARLPGSTHARVFAFHSLFTEREEFFFSSILNKHSCDAEASEDFREEFTIGECQQMSECLESNFANAAFGANQVKDGRRKGFKDRAR
jgi:hypothetical protein